MGFFVNVTILAFHIVCYRPHILFYCIFCVESNGVTCENGKRRLHSKKSKSLCVKSPPISYTIDNYLNYFSRNILHISIVAFMSVIYAELFRFEMHAETLKCMHTQNYMISCVVADAGGVKYTTRQIK